MYTKYLTYLNNVADIDHRVKKAIINIIETMRPDPTDAPELTLFKTYCLPLCSTVVSSGLKVGNIP